MNEEFKTLKERADKARILYNRNLITRAEAHVEILPFIEAFNRKTIEIAKKFGQRPRTITFASFVR